MTNEPLIPTQNPVPGLTAAWDSVRQDLAQRRAARLARKQLRRDLAAYTTQDDLDDMYAVLDRYDDDRTAAAREILARQQIHAA